MASEQNTDKIYNYAVILVVVLLVVLAYSKLFRTSSSEITYDIAAEGSSKIQNDMMAVRLTIKSNTSRSPSEAYDTILHSIEAVKQILSNEPAVSNVVIKNRTDTEYGSDNRTVRGYRAVSSISYDISVANKKETLHAAQLQKQIIELSVLNETKTIDSMSYFMSSDATKKAEANALKNAIERGKHDASILLSAAHPGHDYIISKITVNNQPRFSYGRSMNESVAVSSTVASAAKRDVISQGESTVTASVVMIVSVI